MTNTFTPKALTSPKFKSTPLGQNKSNIKRPVGIITYNTTTGQKIQCEVFSTFWVGATPSQTEMVMYLIHKGYGLFRISSLKYASLI